MALGCLEGRQGPPKVAAEEQRQRVYEESAEQTYDFIGTQIFKLTLYNI